MVKSNLGSIRNRFKIKLAEKETRDNARYTYRYISAVTGIAASTLTDWSNNRLRFVATDTLAALCSFLGCKPGDLLEYIPPSSNAE